MELRHLRYFAAVADAGNASRAARRLHVMQPALSRQIQDLERDFVCQLAASFSQGMATNSWSGPGGSWPTPRPYGSVRELWPAGGWSVPDRGDTTVHRGSFARGADEIIRFGIPRNRGAARRGRGRSPCQAVQQGELHLAIGVWRTGGFQSRPLYPARVLAVMRRRHRLAGRNSPRPPAGRSRPRRAAPCNVVMSHLMRFGLNSRFGRA